MKVTHLEQRKQLSTLHLLQCSDHIKAMVFISVNIIKETRAEGVAQWVKRLPTMCNAPEKLKKIRRLS